MKYLIKPLFILFFLITTLNTGSFAAEPQSIVKWNSAIGLERLKTSEYKNDFYQLADYFQPQLDPLYCAIASSVIVLNSIANGEAPSQKEIEVVRPKVLGGNSIEFRSYSQINFLNEKTDKIKDRRIIQLKNVTPETENDAKNFDPGLSLGDLKTMLVKAYGLKVKIKYIDNAKTKTLNEFREVVKKTVVDNTHYLLANFDGKVLGLKTGGHMSPIVAYDEASDSLLIMDVAGHKNGWYWAEAADFLKAMNTKDGENYRGYLLISK